MPRPITPRDFAEAHATIRTLLAPSPTDPDAIETPCKDCGEPFWQRPRQRKDCCAECGAKREIQCQEDMRNKSGLYYRRYVAKQLAHWVSEHERLSGL
jgi:hypothetical protein